MPRVTDDLTQWLGEQLDEDERIARRAASYDDGARHDVRGPAGTWMCLDDSEWFGPSYRGGVISPRIGQANAPELGAHIVRHDPARVLQEIEAKRRIIDDCKGVIIGWHHEESWELARDVLRNLAAPYADRSGYRQEWRP